MRKRSTQGRRIIAVLKERPLTYAQMLRLGEGNSPWRRVEECLSADEVIVKGEHQPSGCVTWAVRTVRQSERAA